MRPSWTQLAAACLLAVSCSSEPRLDLSSDESFGRSMAALNASLSPADQDKLSGALAVIIPHALGMSFRESIGKPGTREKLSDAISGKTATELIEEAERINAATRAPAPR